MALMGTTICAVMKDGKIAVAGDGQVTMGEHTIFKATAHKVRRIYGGKVVTGFAGSVADAFALCERFESKLEQYSGNLERAAVELAQEWRADKVMRKLEAMLIVASGTDMMIISGTGEVITPDDGIAAARALEVPREARILAAGRDGIADDLLGQAVAHWPERADASAQIAVHVQRNERARLHIQDFGWHPIRHC